MSASLVHLFLALVLLCSGFTAPERLQALLAADRAEMALHAADGSHPPTQVASDHEDRSDDLSPHAHVDLQPDLVGLIDVQQKLSSSTMTMAPPRPWASGGYRAPFLAGLQRPPCMPNITA